MGVVWRARDETLERDVALKVIHPWIADDEEARRRFGREAQVLGQLTHEHIVRVYDYREARETAFLVMELVEGDSLAETTARHLPLTWPHACRYLAPVCEALSYAHRKEIVHRDLTPTNVLIERETQRVVVTDFGLARLARTSRSLTSSGYLIGTPEFWSPEQAAGRETSSASDMYALGCILFQLLTTHLPFEGTDRLALGFRRVLEDAPTLAEWITTPSPEAAGLTSSLLDRDSESRPSAEEAAKTLRAGAASPDVENAVESTRTSLSARPTERLPHAVVTAAIAIPRTEKEATRRHRNGAIAGVIAASLFALVIGIGVAARQDEGSSGAAGGDGQRATFTMPNLVGIDLAHAKQLVTNRARAQSATRPEYRVTRSYSERSRSGSVLAQFPRVGSDIMGGATVWLRVSRGSAYAPIPQIAPNTPVDSARVTLSRAGFRSALRYRPSWSIRNGAVVRVSPSPGSRLRRPSSVSLFVSTGVPRTSVPNVRGSDLADAERMLSTWGLRYRLSYRSTSDYDAGQVLRQAPLPGTRVSRGGSVDLVVARQPTWQTIYSQSGASAFQSRELRVPAKWRIRYQLGTGDAFGFGSATFAILGRGIYDYFQADAGKSGRYYPEVGGGYYRIIVDPSSVSWWFEVDVLK